MPYVVIMAGERMLPIQYRLIFSDVTHDEVELMANIDGLTKLFHPEGTVLCLHDVITDEMQHFVLSQLFQFTPTHPVTYSIGYIFCVEVFPDNAYPN